MENDNKAPERGVEERPAKRRTLYQLLHLMPTWLGAALGVLLVLVSIPAGNWKALDSQVSAARRVWEGYAVDGTAVPEAERLTMEDILLGRVKDAANLVTVMNRYPEAAGAERAALEAARGDMRSAKEPDRVKTANTALQKAMNAAITALFEQARLDVEDQQLVQQVVDDFNDHGRKLRVRVRDYDRVMQKALNIYNELPTRALFSQPELFGEM